ncbi:MAG: hypothetical protein M3Q48_13050, partial [Actinomycetota bacterium]|nr:hypothetical protein [Actinomycetota bacterium]
MRHSVTTSRPPRLGPGVVAVVVAALLGLPGNASRAGADPLADKRAEAERVAGELEARGRQASQLTEQLNQARLRAARVTEQARTAEAELRQADEGVALARARLRDRAVDSYVRSGRLPVVQLLLGGNRAEDMGVRRAYASTVAGGERAAAEALAVAREQA